MQWQATPLDLRVVLDLDLENGLFGGATKWDLLKLKKFWYIAQIHNTNSMFLSGFNVIYV